MNLSQKRRCRRVPKSISPARRQPAPVVLTDDPVEWWFDVGGGVQAWNGKRLPELRSMRSVRTPHSKANSRHVPVYAYSTTTGEHIRLESGLEHDLLRELDRRRDVTWLVSQPMRLRLPAKRARRRMEHTPDLLSVDSEGVVTVWDVRAARRQDEDFRIKSQLTASACPTMGWHYEVFAGLTRVRRANLMWLHGFRREPADYATTLGMLLRDTRISTIGAVLDGDDKGRQFTACMWHAVWRGDLLCDLDRQLSRSTSVSRPRAEAPA
jgi:hypothetical protein